MQIVIDVPNWLYNVMLEHKESTYSQSLGEAVRDGFPLPKGHGRLIDADKLEYTCNSDECGMLTGCNHCQYHIITEDELDNAPTIIETDKESEDKK